MNKKKLSEDSCLGVPDELWEELNNEFGFTVDVCASHINHKCPHYYTKEEDGLQQDWRGEVVWCHRAYLACLLSLISLVLLDCNHSTF